MREEGQRVRYETEDGEYSLPRSLVDRVEKSSGPATGPRRSPAIEELAPAVPAANPAGAPVRANGEIDTDLLDRMAARPPATPEEEEKLAGSFLAAMEHEVRRGRPEAALGLGRRGLAVLPRHPRLALAQGALLLRQQRYQEARQWFDRARLAAPNSPAVWKMIGLAEYLTDRTHDAIRAWEKSLALAPDASVRNLLERARRETAAESGHQQAYSPHFTLRFEGQQVSPAFSRAILDTLEEHYSDLEILLGISLREPVPAILYTEQAFRDVTRVPSWVGALNDGRLRVPIEGLTSMTPKLSEVLRHEVAHSMVWARSAGRAPAWLNEGLAQMVESDSASRLAEFRLTGRRLPLEALQHSFLRLPPEVVPFAYTQSLATVYFLAAQYGLGEVVRVLTLIGQGQSPEAALHAVYRMHYRGLDNAMDRFFTTRR